MRRWKHKVDVSKFFRNEELTFDERKSGIVKIFSTSSAVKDGDDGEELKLLVDELAQADDEDEFDWIWDDIYNLADSNKWLWIETIGPIK